MQTTSKSGVYTLETGKIKDQINRQAVRFHLTPSNSLDCLLHYIPISQNKIHSESEG
jgi:hypothetical protein